jgi:nuclear polyadenylated RNA-binding protein 3
MSPVMNSTEVASTIETAAPAADVVMGDSLNDSSLSDAYAESDENQKSSPSIKNSTPGPDDYGLGSDSEVESATNDTSMPTENTLSDRDQPPNDANAPISPSNGTNTTVPLNSSSIVPTQAVDTAEPEVDGVKPASASMESATPAQESSIKEIDIQRILDNITAKADMEASAQETDSIPAVPSDVAPAPSLSTYASLPQHAYNNPQYSMPPPPGLSGSPGVHPTYGAPGTTAALPSPTGATYTGAPGAPGVAAPPSAAYAQPQNPPDVNGEGRAKDRPERNDGEDTGEVQWGPDVQKLYDEFLAEERSYVAEGQWDKFPGGSRLFIGKFIPFHWLDVDLNGTRESSNRESDEERPVLSVPQIRQARTNRNEASIRVRSVPRQLCLPPCFGA